LTTYIPESIGRLWTQADLARHPLQSLLRRHGYAAATGQQIVTATQAGPSVAEGLGVELGTPLLRVQRSAFTAAGLPIEYIDILGPATSFDLRMTLRPGPADG
jgi:GntR family transcriptional regulator